MAEHAVLDLVPLRGSRWDAIFAFLRHAQ
jgi:hypothetical protein